MIISIQRTYKIMWVVSKYSKNKEADIQQVILFGYFFQTDKLCDLQM